MELQMETIGWTPIKLMLNPHVILSLPEPKASAFSPLSEEESLSLLGSPVITPLGQALEMDSHFSPDTQ